MSMTDTFCPACGASTVNIDALPTEKPSDYAAAYDMPEQSYSPDMQAQPEQPYQADMQGQPYAPEQEEQPYVQNMQVQPFPPEQQIPQQHGAPQQPQYMQPPQQQMYGQVQNPQYPQQPQQYAQPMPPQMYQQVGQMPYAQQPPYGGYPQQPAYPGTAATAGETPNIPAAIIVLFLDLAFSVTFFLNTLFATSGFGGKAETSFFKLYEYFVQLFETIKRFFDLVGQTGVDSSKLDITQFFPGEMWVTIGVVLTVYILYLIHFISVIVAIVRVFTARGPRVIYFWGSAGTAAGTAFSAFLISFGACILFNLKASGFLDGVSGAKYREYMGVNWLFYVMFGLSLAAVIIVGVMKSMARKKYMMNPGPYRTGTPPQTNMYR